MLFFQDIGAKRIFFFFQTVQNLGGPVSQFTLCKFLNPGPRKNAGSTASRGSSKKLSVYSALCKFAKYHEIWYDPNTKTKCEIR
jgi:hypothetical protein